MGAPPNDPPVRETTTLVAPEAEPAFIDEAEAVVAGGGSYTLTFGTISEGGAVMTNGSIGIVGQALAGRISNATYTIEVGAVPCLGAAPTTEPPVEPPGASLWVTFKTNATVPGVGAVENEDIVAYDLNTGAWSIVFDGSDVGLSAFVIDGMAREPDGDILLSFTVAGNLPGLIGGPAGQTIDDSDIVRFVPTSFGSTTAGSFTFHFDGSDVGLTTDYEDIDSIALTSDGRLLLSCTSSFIANNISGADEDLMAFAPTNLGATTTGTVTMYFDGSDVGLTSLDENIDGAGVTAEGTILLSTVGYFAVTGAAGEDEDVFEFSPTSVGSTTAGTYSFFLDLNALGIAVDEDIADLELVE